MKIQLETGRQRAVVEHLAPQIDGGAFAIKRVVGQRIVVSADVVADGHDCVSAVLKYRRDNDLNWAETAMRFAGNDRWQGEFVVSEVGRYRYTVQAWVDHFQSWQRDFRKRVEAGQELRIELQIGAGLMRQAASRATGDDAQRLRLWAATIEHDGTAAAVELAQSIELAEVMARWSDRRLASTYGRDLVVVVDRPRAAFSSWYELFPRSCSPTQGKHGTLADCQQQLAEIARLGFDVVYLPPIHPIGRSHRKGPNGVATAGPDDPGSPWAIGAAEGGHKSVHPQLGTLEDFDRLLEAARAEGLEIAMDLAYQCAPDHPYVREHPQWFRQRPDGSVQYAENPPKKYQDIYPFDFECEAWRDLWDELKDIALFWVRRGVRIFRVDNPHTKPFAFWQWLIDEIKAEDPNVLFLAEAFTRPKVMNELARLGFTQSYTYFTWRNTKQELIDYCSQLAGTELREFFRANFWPNTPDILSEYLQFGGRPAFVARLVLAATLSSNYGIYGPAFELVENQPREPGSEEYLDSEKYQLRHWDVDRPDSLREIIRRVNRIRRENPALQRDGNLRFHLLNNDQLICYTRHCPARKNTVLVVVNLDPHHVQSGWVELDLAELEIEADRPYQVHDELGGARYLWHGPRNFVQLDPQVSPAHVFVLRRHVRTEQQFDYFM